MNSEYSKILFERASSLELVGHFCGRKTGAVIAFRKHFAELNDFLITTVPLVVAASALPEGEALYRERGFHDDLSETELFLVNRDSRCGEIYRKIIAVDVSHAFSSFSEGLISLTEEGASSESRGRQSSRLRELQASAIKALDAKIDEYDALREIIEKEKSALVGDSIPRSAFIENLLEELARSQGKQLSDEEIDKIKTAILSGEEREIAEECLNALNKILHSLPASTLLKLVLKLILPK